MDPYTTPVNVILQSVRRRIKNDLVETRCRSVTDKCHTAANRIHSERQQGYGSPVIFLTKQGGSMRRGAEYPAHIKQIAKLLQHKYRLPQTDGLLALKIEAFRGPLQQ